MGFELLETTDLAERPGPGIPGYEPLAGSMSPLAGLRHTNPGWKLTRSMLRVLEAAGVVPRGSLQVARLLNRSAVAMVEYGRLGIFTPMYFLHVRKLR